MSERDVTLRDGRTLHVYDDGDPDGHRRRRAPRHAGQRHSLRARRRARARARAAPRSATTAPATAARRRIPGASSRDVAHDIEDVLDALGVERFATCGGSGGGPHALALRRAARRPLRRRRRARVRRRRGTPRGSTGSPAWASRTSRSSAAALRAPDALEALLEPRRRRCAPATPDELREVLGIASAARRPRGRSTGERAEHVEAELRPRDRARHRRLARRRPCLRPAVGLRARRDPRARSALAGRTGPDGPGRPWPLARGADPRRRGAHQRGRRPPLDHGRPPRGDLRLAESPLLAGPSGAAGEARLRPWTSWY